MTLMPMKPRNLIDFYQSTDLGKYLRNEIGLIYYICLESREVKSFLFANVDDI